MKFPEASFCSFCGNDRQHTFLLIQSGQVAICESCTGTCGQIIIEHFTGQAKKMATIRFEDGPKPAVEQDPDRAGGLPVVAGTRLTLAQLLAELAEGHALKEIADDQNLSFEDLAAALRELAQPSSDPPGGTHRMANPEPCVGPAENPDDRLRTGQTGGTGRASTNRERAEALLKRIEPLFPLNYWEPNITATIEEALTEAEARGRSGAI
jgi:uncharacterized protein (DUF433 family)